MASIVRLASQAADHPIDQKSFASHIAKASKLDSSQTSWLHKLYQTSDIDRRYSCLEDFANNPFWQNGSPTTAARNALYKEHAPILSQKACEKVLADWDRASITHIIYVSCTGVIAPGIQTYLQKTLGLSPDVCQFGLNMMGCFGAFKALQMADAFCSQNQKTVVLIVCTELCSLHFQPTQSYEQQVGNALFADASAACIVANERTGFRLHRHKSRILANSQDKMTWDLVDTGLVLGLKKEVPDLLKEHIGSFVDQLLPKGYDVNDYAWPIHPGGKGILQAVEDALGLTRQSTETSWAVLNQYGNVSSASFLFVLERLRTEKQWAVGLGFGPGLSFEGLLLEVNLE